MSDAKNKRSWSRWAVGLMTLGVGCNAAPEGASAPVDPSAWEDSIGRTTQGATTQTKTVSWVAQTGTGLCRFGDTSLNHLPATNTVATARTEEVRTITGMAGRRITSIKLSSTDPSFNYDDVLLLNYNDHLVMASDKRVATYSNNNVVPGTSPVPYSWSNIRGNAIDNIATQQIWCAYGSTTCQAPLTEKPGALTVEVPSFNALDEAAYPTAPDVRSFKLVTIGDNDNTTDCTHGALSLTLTITSEPITSCSFTSQQSYIYAGPSTTDGLYGYGPFSFTWNTSTGAVTGGYFTETLVEPYASRFGAGPYYNVVASGTKAADNSVSLAFTRSIPNTYSFSFSGSLSGNNRVTGIMDGGVFEADGSMLCK